MESASKSMNDRIRMDLLYRMHWNIGSLYYDIGFHPGKGQSYIGWARSSFDYALAEPPLKRVEVNIYECHNKVSVDHAQGAEEEKRYEPPPPLIIESDRGDDRGVTLKRFVALVHDYFKEHRKEIMRVKLEAYSKPSREMPGGGTLSYIKFYRPGYPSFGEGTQIYFKRVWAVGTGDEDVKLYVELFADGDNGWDMWRFWDNQMQQWKLYEEQSTCPTVRNCYCTDGARYCRDRGCIPGCNGQALP